LKWPKPVSATRLIHAFGRERSVTDAAIHTEALNVSEQRDGDLITLLTGDLNFYCLPVTLTSEFPLFGSFSGKNVYTPKECQKV
jgi:hypothetical protein